MAMDNKLSALAAGLPDSVDAVLLTSDINRRYYTGFPSSAGTVILTRDQAYLIIDSRYHGAAVSAVKNAAVILQDKLFEQIAQLLEKHGVKNLGIEEQQVSLAEFEVFKEKLPAVHILHDAGISGLINKQRRKKTQSELDNMRKAQDLADQTFAYILGYIRPGLSEKDIALEMEFYSRRNGSEEASFSFIVASGENSAVPHAVPGDRTIRNGDFIVFDFGCVINGYHSDMTRTVGVGAVSEKQKHVYETVLRAQRAAMEVIKPGAACAAVDKAARDLIDSAGYKGLFGHGLGHSLGLEIHEPPNFNPSSDVVLEPGFVLSVEPGIYIPGEFGVRIEDVIAVTEDGFINFMASEKDLVIL
jgi:Xaa-Pro aminopeptidase